MDAADVQELEGQMELCVIGTRMNCNYDHGSCEKKLRYVGYISFISHLRERTLFFRPADCSGPGDDE